MPLISKATNVTQLVPLTRTPRTHHSEATAALEDVTTVSAHGFAEDRKSVV